MLRCMHVIKAVKHRNPFLLHDLIIVLKQTNIKSVYNVITMKHDVGGHPRNIPVKLFQNPSIG